MPASFSSSPLLSAFSPACRDFFLKNHPNRRTLHILVPTGYVRLLLHASFGQSQRQILSDIFGSPTSNDAVKY